MLDIEPRSKIMTGDTADAILSKLQYLHKELNGKNNFKHGQQALEFNMFEYEDPDEDTKEVHAKASANPSQSSEGSFPLY